MKSSCRIAKGISLNIEAATIMGNIFTFPVLFSLEF